MNDDLKNIKVMVKSLSTGAVTYSSDIRHVRREWLREGQVIPIPADELQEVLYDQGIYNLFALGYLGIDNPDHRKLIGLEYEGIGPQMVPFDRRRAQELLKNSDLKTFEERLYDIRTKTGQIETLIMTAYDMKDIDYNKQKLIKEMLGVDLMSLIRNNEEN